MKTKEEIKERLNQNISGYTKEGIRCIYDRLETMFVERNILEWILEGEDLSTCEANSNALLAEVRAYINERIKYYESKQDMSHYHNTIYELKKISEHFS